MIAERVGLATPPPASIGRGGRGGGGPGLGAGGQWRAASRAAPRNDGPRAENGPNPPKLTPGPPGLAPRGGDCYGPTDTFPVKIKALARASLRAD